jgi:hypothetical protein
MRDFKCEGFEEIVIFLVLFCGRRVRKSVKMCEKYVKLRKNGGKWEKERKMV